jgi:Fe-S oxidoreductase
LLSRLPFRRPSTRFFLTLGLCSMLSSALLMASFAGLIPDRLSAQRQGHVMLAETLAATVADLVERRDTARLRAMLALAPARLPPVSRNDDPQVFAPRGAARMRVALMTGCAQRALNTDINDATIRLLTRLGAEVVVVEGAGCCGAIVHHMGRSAEGHAVPRWAHGTR